MFFGLVAIATLGFGGDDPAVHQDRRYEYKEVKDLAYHPDAADDDTLRRLNLVLPEGASDCPLFVWIGGGAWSIVDRNKEMDLARRLASHGIAVASIGHRLSPATWIDPKLDRGVRHPAHIEDLAEAFRWLHENAKTYGYAQGKMFVGGFSSGAHLAALLSADARRLEKVGLSPKAICGVIPIAGAYDISDYHQAFLKAEGDQKRLADLHVKAVFGDTEDDFADASPSTYLKDWSVPMLLVSERGTYGYTKVFEEQIRNAEFKDVIVVNFHKYDHGGLWKNLSFEDTSECRDMIEWFIRSRSAAKP